MKSCVELKIAQGKAQHKIVTHIYKITRQVLEDKKTVEGDDEEERRGKEKGQTYLRQFPFHYEHKFHPQSL
jgi:hypothetical protein